METSYFDINQNKLDEEWQRQPQLFRQHAFELAEAKKEYEELKVKKELAIAELDRKIRRNPDKYGLDKITENVVEKAIILTKRYQEVTREVIEAKHKMDIHQATVDTLDHRKKALENLVHLFSMNYFAEPKAPNNGTSKEALEYTLSQKKGRRNRE